MLPSSEAEPKIKDNDTEIQIIEKKIQAFNTAQKAEESKILSLGKPIMKNYPIKKAKRVMYVPEIDNNGYLCFVFMVKDVTCGEGMQGQH